ncbi:putative glutamate decarboxylase [Diplodia seriata]|uniref:Glutamate decarboxylase n=1 Tax=Diplodia seriata TaxID=420778 RepID=A0A0G2EJ73_9PEZI|nr:putative glutamate decarboxylase [Diplodia seriata]
MASLASHIDPDELIQKFHDHPAHHRGFHSSTAVNHNTPYSSRYASISQLSKFKMPHDGAPADAVHQMLKDELDLDGRPNLNLASFVGTYMEEQAEKLMIENLSKNMSDADEYPAMMQMHSRCVSILSHLWGVQKGEKAIGSATTGSSEAIHLGGLAMKRRWQEKRRAEGKSTEKPNIIMGANAQVALEKFARYFEVEARILPVSEKSLYRLDPDLVRENIDENTIGVFVILGSTYTGHYEPVEEISKILDEYEAKTGVDIPIHVDGASGAFIAPFTHAQAGGPKWNFELPRVKSINVSGHKFGLVYAGVGWIIWRDESYLPKHLIFELHYLGGTEESYTLNFSRPGAQIIAQYYNLIHLGFTGYRTIMENALSNARLLSRALEATGWYECVSDIHRKKGDHKFVEGQKPYEDGENSAAYNAGLPVVAFTLSKKFKEQFPHVKQVSISNLLRAKQYIIPNYPLPPNEEKTEILRVVVRESMSLDLLDRLITDICAVTETVMQSDEIDLAAWQPFANTIEKTHGSRGVSSRDKHKAKRPMHHDEDDFSEDDEYSQESDYDSYGEDDEDDDDVNDYDEYYDDYGYDYDEGETPDDSDIGMPDIESLSIDDPGFDPAAADPRLCNRCQASERPVPIDMVWCMEFIQTELDNDAQRAEDAMEVTVRRLPMVWAWRDFMSYCGVEGVLTPAVRQQTGLGDERAAAQTLALVEREALPAIEAWMARREGRVWEARALRQAWVAEGAGRLGPEVVECLWLLSGIVLAWRLGREIDMFAESL